MDKEMKDMIDSWNQILQKSKPRREQLPTSVFRLEAMAKQLHRAEGTMYHMEMVRSMCKLREEDVTALFAILGRKDEKICKEVG